ncbi:MAG TPA: hypothetical protein VNK41_10290 [Vicinamibacterales bacterium]|nr:hypothetical protein [Vicinamibacterales bacterium]
MSSSLRRSRIRDVIGSIVGFLAVFGTLILVDERVWYHLRSLVSGGAPREITDVGKQFEALGDALLLAIRDQSIDHAPLLIFSAVAIVLVVFMVRT